MKCEIIPYFGILVVMQNQTAKDALTELVMSCHYDPLKFVMMAYPWGERGPLQNYNGPDTWQEEFLIEWGEEIRKRNFNGVDAVAPIRMTRSSGHGVGKSIMSAWVTDFIMSTRPNCRGTVTANTFGQLETKTWAAIQKWTKYCITSDWFEITGSIMYRKGSRESWFTSAMSCAEENSQAFAGQHSADSTSFYVVDEGSNVPDAIYNIADGGLTDGEPMIFVWGNPTRSSGKFFRINFSDERHRWLHKAIDSRLCKFTNKALIKEWAEDWGENSDRFRVQVKGLPPSASDLQFISTTLVTGAQEREALHLKNDPLICGLDIARGGNDVCVFRFRRGLDARSVPAIRIPGDAAKNSTVVVDKALDILQNGVMIKRPAAYDEMGSQTHHMEHVRVSMLMVDGGGIGGPICDQLKNLGFADRVTEIQFSWEAPNTQGYQECANMRAWMYELLRVWLVKGAIDKSSDLESDLVGPMYHYDTKNRLVMESKSDMKKRRGTAEHSGSPDESDALALTFARPVSPTKSLYQAEREFEEIESGFNYGGGSRGRVWG